MLRHAGRAARPFAGPSSRTHSSKAARLRPGAAHARCRRRCGSGLVSVRAQTTATRAAPGLTMPPWTGSPQEEQALQVLQRRMQSCADGMPDVETQQWFLRDRKLDVDEAADKLTRMMEWRRGFMSRPLAWADVEQEAATGKAYLHAHRDVNGRPVIIVRASRHITGERPLEDSTRLCAYLLEAAIAELPEGSETILGIFDLRGFGPRNADLGFVRFLVDAFFLYYPKRLGQVLFVDAPWAFKPGWEMVKPWLKKYAALVRFVSREEVRREYFAPGTCPADFQ